MFCIHCGTKLPENARFCINCGVKVKIYSEEMHSVQHTDLRSEPLDTHNEQPMSENDELAKIFASLDPVACHAEYYMGYVPLLQGLKMAVNRNWILKGDWNSDTQRFEYILMDENGKNQRPLDISLKLRKHEYEKLMGFNNKGVWFWILSQGSEDAYNTKFLCIDVVNGEVHEYPIERRKGEIRSVYIYNDEICYINDVTKNKQILYRQTPNESIELMSTHKDENIFCVSADSSRIAWGFSSNREGEECSFWYVWNKQTVNQTKITVPMRSDMPWIPALKILSVDLARNFMYTTLTDGEKQRLGMNNDIDNKLENLGRSTCYEERPRDRYAIALRKIADPEEDKILTYKKDKSFAVWPIKEDPSRGYGCYFDTQVLYERPDSYKINRRDRLGGEYHLGYTNHGECEKILVTDKWLYVNYDAYDMVRLPKKFSEHQGAVCDNPEAFFIFGKGTDYRM